jgi:DNA-binding HxlR family transcriptional regulator
VPVTVEYRLTELGHDLAATVAALREWAYRNIERVESARADFDQNQG